MKTSVKIFSFFFAVATMIACAGAESEQLKEARTIQEAMMKQKHNLDSTLNLKMDELSAKISELSSDTTLATDSLKTATYVEVKNQYTSLENWKSQMADWSSNIKTLPTLEELAGGAENPFGKDAKDQDILAGVKANQAAFEELKSEIETAIQ
jgi:hypothetical protein